MKWIDIPPLWLLLHLVAAWAFQPFFTIPEPHWLKLAGAFVALVGFAVIVWAGLELMQAQTTVIPHRVPRVLVRNGPYGVSRNPIYLGDALILTGAILWWAVLPALLLVPVFVWIITRRFIIPEEASLRHEFGRDFEHWAQNTRRWM